MGNAADLKLAQQASILERGPVATVAGQETGTGKSTFAKNLVGAMRLHGIEAHHVMIESLGQSSDCEHARIEPTDQALAALIPLLAIRKANRTQILDIGGHAFDRFAKASDESNNTLLRLIKTYVVPINTKADKPSSVITMLQRITDSGVPPERIVCVFNRVVDRCEREALANFYAVLYEYASSMGIRIARAVIYECNRIRTAHGRQDLDIWQTAALSVDDIILQIAALSGQGDVAGAERLAEQLKDHSFASLPVGYFNTLFNEIFVGEPS